MAAGAEAAESRSAAAPEARRALIPALSCSERAVGCVAAAGVLGTAILILGAWHAWKAARVRKQYVAGQRDRQPLPAQEFCQLAGIPPDRGPIVDALRSALAEFVTGSDPEKILPSDDLNPFGFEYSDDLEAFVDDLSSRLGFATPELRMPEDFEVGNLAATLAAAEARG